MFDWRRSVGLTATMAAFVLVAGCGTQPMPPPPTPPSPPPPAVNPYDDGVTKPADVFGPDCGAVSQNVAALSRRPVSEAIASDPELSVFSDAVKRSGLVGQWDHLLDATVFAPTNNAFSAFRDHLGATRYDALMADPARLGRLLNYHLIPKRFDRDGLLAETAGVATLYGGVLQAQPAPGTITVTDGSRTTSTVQCGNIPAANATVFVVDQVLKTDPDE